jgi:hypothetical protein
MRIGECRQVGKRAVQSNQLLGPSVRETQALAGVVREPGVAETRPPVEILEAPERVPDRAIDL